MLVKPYKVIASYFDKEMIVEVGHTFCCYPQLEQPNIEIPIVENIIGSRAFYNKMQKRLQQYKIEGTYSNEILSFLHEIGHIYTYTRWNEIKYNFATTIIQMLQAKFCSPKLINFFYNRYFNLKLEKLADKWAMNFIKNNQELVNQWQNMLIKNYQKYLPRFVEHMKTHHNIDLLAQ